ncbi:MAG: MFS transporter [Betaproteobacteria bacterium]|nr:MFS transporter [Betaproteobacteria bacterium]
MAIALTAVGMHASPLVIGTIAALYGLLPMLVSVSVGKLNDRIGPRTPMIAGTIFFVVGGLLPAFQPGLLSLYIAATLMGIGNMIFQLSIQNAVGQIGGRDDRIRNFSTLAIGMSSGAIVGPLIAGYAIDYAGYEPAFIFLSLLPVVALIMLTAWGHKLPGPSVAARPGGPSRTLDLLSNSGLLTIYLLAGLHVITWELFSFLMPVHGSQIGLSASVIGVIMGAFSAASFTMRVLLPPLVKLFGHWQLIKAFLITAGVVFAVLPLTNHILILVLLSALIGACLGATQPLTMTLIHDNSPPGRIGESLGVRTTVVCSFQFIMPLVFGGLGSLLGLAPVFWMTAVAVCVGVAAIRPTK